MEKELYWLELEYELLSSKIVVFGNFYEFFILFLTHLQIFECLFSRYIWVFGECIMKRISDESYASK